MRSGVTGRLVAALGAVSLLVSLAACSDDDAEPGPASAAPPASPSASTGTASASPEPSEPAPSGDGDSPAYVALGDSYTAAPGVPTTVDPACGRSDRNYPSLVAADLGLALTDVSCSGADTLSLVGAQQTQGGAQPPQLLAVGEDAALVTLGVGGNDEGLFGDLVQTCLGVASQDRAGSPCREAMNAGGEDRALAAVETIRTRLVSALTGIKDRAPDAEVVLIGYPQIVPARGTCETLPLADGDYAYVGEVTAALARATKRAAREAGVAYADVYAASAGRDVCAGPDAWVNGIANDLGRPAAPLHPFAEEQVAVADLVAAAIGDSL